MPELTKEQLYIILGVIFVLIIGCIYGLYGRKTIITRSSPVASTSAIIPKIQRNNGQIYVDVSGAVCKEGVFRLDQGDRMVDVLKMAVVSPNADLEGLNLAEILSDSQKVVVPFKTASSGPNTTQKASTAKKSLMVNINKADAKELDGLPGIGPTMAQRIVEYRDEKGRFANIEQLKEVQGISDKKFSQLSKHITVN